MRAVDTNVLVRLLVRDDTAQTDAAEAFIRGGAWVPHIALVETVWVLDSVYSRSRAAIAAVIEGLLNHESLVIQDAPTVASALLAFRSSRGVDFSDCIILAAAQRAGHKPLGTFDSKLARLEGAEMIG